MWLIIIVFSLFACGESGSDEIKPEPKPPIVTPDNGKELMFLIDEGLKGDELIAKYKDNLNSLDISLENIYKTIAPLQKQYELSVLIYPTWLYNENGYGQGSGSIGVNRINPALIHTFNYFKKKNVGVYLEMYSSGIYTAQNGELGNQPLVKRRYGKTETVKSLPLDLDCLEDILSKYDIVKGVRFHELIGTHEQKDNGHGFEVDLSLTTEIAEICKKYNKKLIWGDHSWNLAYTDPGKYGFWLTYLEKACDILGEDITVNFNNNGWGAQMVALQYSRTMANFRNNNKWGYSVQSWWWQEKDAESLARWPNGDVRWYDDAYFDMPPELMAAFTLETFKRGGSLVQFEPSFYLFNHYNPASTETKRLGQYEQTPDYSGKLILKRLIKALLDYNATPNSYPSMKPSDYYVDNRSDMIKNKWSAKPKTYNQTTLTVLGDKMKCFDTYISNVGNWYNDDENRYRSWVLNGNVTDAIRVKVDFRLIDEILVVKEKNGQPVAEFYNYMSSHYTDCNNIVETNVDGKLVSITALNLKRNYAGQNNTFVGDPDEIVVARSNGNKINFTVYEKVAANNGAWRQNFAYSVDNTLTAQVNSQFGEIKVSGFIQILGMRTMNILYQDNTRSLDNLMLATKTADNRVQITGKIRGAVTDIDLSKVVDINPNTIKDIKSADANCDYIDEIAFLTNDNSVKFYECKVKNNYDLVELSVLPNVGTNVRKLLSTRWTTYFNE